VFPFYLKIVPESGIDLRSEIRHLALVFVSSVLIAIDNFLV
jgi:hypothetical protein